MNVPLDLIWEEVSKGLFVTCHMASMLDCDQVLLWKSVTAVCSYHCSYTGPCVFSSLYLVYFICTVWWVCVCSWLQVMGPVSIELILLLKLNTAGLLEEILACLWNLKIHYYLYRRLKHLNLFYTFVPYFFNIHFNTVSHLCLSHPRGFFPSSCSKISILKVIYLSSFIWSS
jgi:hypothetical protein